MKLLFVLLICACLFSCTTEGREQKHAGDLCLRLGKGSWAVEVRAGDRE